MADKKDSINPIATKEVDYLDPELATKKEKKSLKDTARDVKFWSKIMGKLLKLVGKAIVSLVKAFIAGLPWTLLIPIVIILIGLVLALQRLPGMMQAKLKSFIKDMQTAVQGWFMTDAEAQLDDMDYSDIVNIANYLEEMGYDLIGDGFVVPELDRLIKYPTFDELIDSGNFEYELGEDNGWHLFENGVIWEGDFTNSEGEVYDCDGVYFNTLGIPVNNKTNRKLTDNGGGVVYKDKYGIIRSTTEKNVNGDGVLVASEDFDNMKYNSIRPKSLIDGEKGNLNNYRLLKTYLLSDNRIFTLRNDDQYSILKKVYGNIVKMFGSYQDAWSRGLMMVYTAEKGIAKDPWGFGDKITGDTVKIDRENVSLKNGYGNKPVNYKIAGWIPRYGLSLDFLLSLHLGTSAPDLVYAMVQNFDTEIQVYLEDSGDSRVDAKYLEPRAETDEPVTIGDISTALMEGTGNDGWSHIGGRLEDFIGDNHAMQDWVNELILTKKNCMIVFNNTNLVSPKNCTGVELSYVVEAESHPERVNTGVEIRGTDYLWDFYNYKDNDLRNIKYALKTDRADEPIEVDATNGLVSARYELSGIINKNAMKYIESDKLIEKYNSTGKPSEEAAVAELETAKINSEDLNTLKNELSDREFENIENGVFRIEKSVIREEYQIYGYYNVDEGEFYYLSEEEADEVEEIDGYPVEEQTIEFDSFLYYIYQDASKYVTEDDNAEGESKKVILVKNLEFYDDQRERRTFKLVVLYDENKDYGTDSVSFKLFDVDSGSDEDWFESGKASIKGIDRNGYEVIGDYLGDNNTLNFKLEMDLPNKGKWTNVVGFGWMPAFWWVEEKTTYYFGIVLNKGNNDSYKFEFHDKVELNAVWFTGSNNFVMSTDGQYDFVENSNNIGEGEKLADIIWTNFVIRNKTEQELIDCGLITIDPDTGEAIYNPDGGQCSDIDLSDSNNVTIRCCTNCQKYVKAVAKALADISDQDFKMYTPYIARVVGSWFRDTYFIVPDDSVDDKAIKGYKKAHQEFDTSKVMGDSVKFVKVDEEYLSDTGEYWSSYEMKEGNPEEYQLFYLNSDGTTSDIKMEDFLQEEHTYRDNEGNQVTKKFATQKEAEDAGFAFVKKAKLYDVKDFAENESSNMQNDDNGLDSNILWSAYSFSVTENTSNWDRINYGDNSRVDEVYEINWGSSDGEGLEGEDTSKGIFYRIMTSNQVTQEEDAQRGETNALVKYLFKYRKYYIYDGTKETAVRIETDRQKVIDEVLNNTIPGFESPTNARNQLMKYGRSAIRDAYSKLTIVSDVFANGIDERGIAEQWIEWQLDMYYMYKYGVDITQYYTDKNNTGADSVPTDLLKITKDPRDQDLVNTVNITKSSLNAFSILENTGTVDAEYQYRDFKELIVELNYFDKEDLSEKPDSVFTWILPETSPMGWPNRIYDKQDVEYGALVQSKATYANLKGEELPVTEGTEGEEGTGEDVQTNPEETGEGTTPETTNPTEGSVDGEGGGTVPSVSTAPNTPLNPVTTVVGDPVTDDTPNTGEDENPPAETDNPQDNNNPQDENPSEDENQTPSVDETKIVFIGDSWTVGLQENNIPKSSYINGKVGENADYFTSHPVTIPDDASAIVIEFGLNNTDKHIETQELAKSLKQSHPNLPIFIVAAPHVSPNYSGNNMNADTFNQKLDEYNDKIKAFCSTADGITYIDPTPAITENGYLKYPSGESDSGTYHMTPEGYKVWYDAIISEINNNSSSDNGTTGKAVFEGWEAEQLVASPVTGKVLEYGTHTRMNIHTGKEEKVGYIIIEPLTEGSDANGNGTKTGYFTDEMVGSVEYTPPEDSDGFDVDTAAKALNLFYKEYDTNCAGYTIMIDGFNVDLQTVDENDNAGAYEKNDVVALYNSKEEKKRIAMEQAKENAPFFINNGESSIPTMEEGYHAPDNFTGLYVKEGKYIGKTTEPSSIEVLDTITPESVISEYEGPADYIRILIKDLDYSVVDNVEDFFNIPEPGFGDSGEGIAGVDQEYQAEPGDLELLADAIHHESGGGACSTYEEKLYVATSMGYTIINKLNSDSEFDSGYPLDWAPGKSKLYNLLALIPSDGKSRSGWYGISRAPQEGDSCGNTFRYRADNNCLNYHNEEWVLEAAKYCLQYDSLNFKCIDTFGDGTDFTAGESMPHTCWEQGTGGTVNLPGNKFWRRHQNYTSDNFFILAEHNH